MALASGSKIPDCRTKTFCQRPQPGCLAIQIKVLGTEGETHALNRGMNSPISPGFCPQYCANDRMNVPIARRADVVQRFGRPR